MLPVLRYVLFAAIAVLVLAAARTNSASGHPAATTTCGLERWTVKTLQDRPSLLPVRRSSVVALTNLPAPTALPDTRLPFERRVFRVVARVVLIRPEADRDLHLVLRDGDRTMIAEAPDPACAPVATPLRRRQMSAVRQAVRLCRAVVVGVGFFDFLHGQTGVAPNGIELHPILGFRCLR